jgi:four helix bundle protein
MAGARSHEELICWQLADELKRRVYALISRGQITRDYDLSDQLRRSGSAAPRLIAEGYGRYLPGDFTRYLRAANGELRETYDALKDGVDRGYFTPEQISPLQRLCKRASKATTSLIAYLRTATPPHDGRPSRRRRHGRSPEPNEPDEPHEPHEPHEPDP